jgi:hypothetical protein
MNDLKNINAAYVFTATVIIIILAVVAYFYYNNPQTVQTETATTTATTTEERVQSTSNTDANKDTMAQKSETETVAPASNSESTSSAGDSPLQVTVQSTPQSPAELGPRQKATSPALALKFFAEAMTARDYERAASYFTPHLQDPFQESFEEKDPGATYPTVSAYFNGEVEEVQLVDPKYGIYEIAVYPQGSQLPFRPRFAYDASIGEYVILEL